MALTIVADTQKELPEALQAKAKQVDGGKFAVAVGTDGFNFENTEGLRSTVSKEREGRQKAERKLKVYGWHVDDDGNMRESAEGAIDPDLARDDRTKVKAGKLETKEPREVEDLRKELVATFKSKTAQMEAEFTERDGKKDAQLRKHIIERDAEDAIRKVGGDENTIKVLGDVIARAARLELNARGEYVPVLYENGKQLISKRSGSADPMGILEFVSTLKEDKAYKVNFPLTRPGGSGADHTGGGSAAGGGTTGTPNGVYGEQSLIRYRAQGVT